ncbi:SMYD5 protein, partial [Amia calva]|nr:SMYD5 protein [Amia calva]
MDVAALEAVQRRATRLIPGLKGMSYGKGLFVKKAIRKGETIFVERPLVSAQFLWNALYKYRACEHCLRSLETAEENARRLSGKAGLMLPYPEQCRVRLDLQQACPHCQVMYCSTECRKAAFEQYHQVLCLGPSRDDQEHPLNKVQEAWRNMHYPPETSSIMLMARMVATVKQARDKGHWQSLFSQFCSRTANEEDEIAHKLLGEKFQGQLALLRNHFTTALYDERLSKWFTPEGFRSLFALVGTNGQGIGTSSLSQWVHGCDALELPAQQREQLDAFIDQLYKDIERGNHSCLPNAEASFPDNNYLLHMTALSDIAPGETPKEEQNVVLLSTLHKTAEISDREDRKPAIILGYNHNIRGVDNLDKVIGTYSSRRMTARWPLVIFRNIIDVSS